MDWWSLSDAELEGQCDRDHYRASGPGGQHRNKTDSAVRLRHRPTGLLVTATERRSQAENRRQAIQRLREALAFEFRSPIAETANRIPAEFSSTREAGSFRVSARNPRFLPIAAYALDMVEHCNGQVSEAGKQLGLGTAQLVKLLRAHPAAWQAAQRIRTSHGLSALR